MWTLRYDMFKNKSVCVLIQQQLENILEKLVLDSMWSEQPTGFVIIFFFLDTFFDTFNFVEKFHPETLYIGNYMFMICWVFIFSFFSIIFPGMRKNSEKTE